MCTACIIFLFSHSFPIFIVIVYLEPKNVERLLYITRQIQKNWEFCTPFLAAEQRKKIFAFV